MALTEKALLLKELSPPLDHLLATQMIDEFISAERRFIQRDWEPAELDGGQFCEIVGRVYYHQDSKNLTYTKDLSECLKYIENESEPHLIIPRHNAIHVARVLRTIYKFRSQRGAVHISPTYEPNHMDAKFIMESIRWVMNETLRIFWRGDREEVAKAIRELLQFDVPCVGKFEEVLLVQRTDLTAEEEILILLHYAGDNGMTRAEIGRHSFYSPSSITTNLQKLNSKEFRQVVFLANGKYRLTDLASKRIREQLAPKLLSQ